MRMLYPRFIRRVATLNATGTYVGNLCEIYTGQAETKPSDIVIPRAGAGAKRRCVESRPRRIPHKMDGGIRQLWKPDACPRKDLKERFGGAIVYLEISII